MLIDVINWEKYNPRNDYHCHWFRVEGSFYLDDKMQQLTCEEFGFWLVLLCLICQKQGRPVVRNDALLSSLSKLPIKRVGSIVSKFEQLHIVRCTDRCTDRSSDCTEQNRTEQNRTEISTDFDFEKIYSKYPRKEGKTQGIRVFKRDVKTQSDYDALAKAVDNYAALCKFEQKEKKFIKHFSTFMNSWKDYLEIPVKSVTHAPKPFIEKDCAVCHGNRLIEQNGLTYACVCSVAEYPNLAVWGKQ